MISIQMIRLFIHWLGGLVAWGTLAVVMVGVWLGTRRTPGKTSGRAFGWLRSWLFYLLAFTTFLALSILGWKPIPVLLSSGNQALTLLLGSLLYFPGIGLVLWGRISLGRMYFVSTSMGAQLFDDHRLITDGPFAWVRHPMYTGLFLAALGGLLIYWTWTMLAFALFSPLVLLRARREEHLLAAAFGEEWQAYCNRVPAFFPRLKRVHRQGPENA